MKWKPHGFLWLSWGIRAFDLVNIDYNPYSHSKQFHSFQYILLTEKNYNYYTHLLTIAGISITIVFSTIRYFWFHHTLEYSSGFIYIRITGDLLVP